MSQRGLFALALLVSLTAHGAAAWYWSAHSKNDGAGEQGMVRVPLRIALTASRSAPAEPQPQAEEPAQPAIARPQPVQQQRPVRRPQPVAAQTPQAATSEPVPLTDAPLQPPQPARAGQGAAPAQPAVDYAGLTDSWRSRVMARIESFKHYPLAARRQRVEGSLEVDLNIACDGDVVSLNVAGASGVLRHAAQRSVQRAAPLPPPPPQLGCPQRLQYAMTYQLR